MMVYRYEKQFYYSFLSIIVFLMCAMHTEAASLPHILVLSETKEWDHQTRTVGDSVILALGRANGFSVTTTDNSDGYFTETFLSTCDAVCFINTTGTILMELVESSIKGSSLDHFHPICWYKNYGNGRVWYTGFGHDPTTFRDTLMIKMLLGGIRYVAKIQSAATTLKSIPSINKPFQTEFLNVYDCAGRVVRLSGIKRTHVSFPILKNNRIHFTSGMYLTVR